MRRYADRIRWRSKKAKAMKTKKRMPGPFPAFPFLEGLFFFFFSIQAMGQGLAELPRDPQALFFGQVRSLSGPIGQTYNNPVFPVRSGSAGIWLQGMRPFSVKDLTYLSLGVTESGGTQSWFLGVQHLRTPDRKEWGLSLGSGKRLLGEKLAAGINLDAYQLPGEKGTVRWIVSGGLGFLGKVSPKVEWASVINGIGLVRRNLANGIQPRMAAGIGYEPVQGVWIGAEVEKPYRHGLCSKLGFQFRQGKSLAFMAGFRTCPAMMGFGLRISPGSRLLLSAGTSFHPQLGWSRAGGIGWKSQK